MQLLCNVMHNFWPQARMTSRKKAPYILITHRVERPTLSHFIVVPCLWRHNKASREAESEHPRHWGMLFPCERRWLAATRPEVALASWWNNQDAGRLPSQHRTLSSPYSGLLPFVDTSTIYILHLSCILIGHAAFVAGCTSARNRTTTKVNPSDLMRNLSFHHEQYIFELKLVFHKLRPHLIKYCIVSCQMWGIFEPNGKN